MAVASRRGIALLSALCALALPVAPTVAAPDTVPPDNSGAAQYTETLPGAEGNQTSKNLRKKQGNTAQKGALGKEEAKRLKALGKEGADAAELAGAARTPANGRAQGGGAGGRESSVSSDPAGSSDSGGIDLVLALLIALTVVAAFALALSLRRNRLS